MEKSHDIVFVDVWTGVFDIEIIICIMILELIID